MAGMANSHRAIYFALGANFAIFLAKGGAAALTGSGVMLAEAVHSLADCGNQLLLLFGIRSARAPASSDHPLGAGKAVYFWSFLVALLLFSVGGMFSAYEGWHKLRNPEPLAWPWAAIGVLGFGILAEGFSMRTCLHEVGKARAGRSLWRWFRESRSSELIVIFGEDLAALLGLLFALFAIVLTALTANPLFDALGTLAIGVLLIVIAIFIAIEVKALLIGQGVDPQVKEAMLAFLDARPEIRRVFNLITLQLGADVMVAVKAEIEPSHADGEMVARINAVERDLKAAFPEIRWSFFEPDVED
ncbi:MAG: cation diffusion facilitator family transporter [Rhodanobacteraceae bacterium]